MLKLPGNDYKAGIITIFNDVKEGMFIMDKNGKSQSKNKNYEICKFQNGEIKYRK